SYQSVCTHRGAGDACILWADPSGDVERVENGGVERCPGRPVGEPDNGLREISALLERCWNCALHNLPGVEALTLPSKEEESAIRAVVQMRNGNRTTNGKAVVILM